MKAVLSRHSVPMLQAPRGALRLCQLRMHPFMRRLPLAAALAALLFSIAAVAGPDDKKDDKAKPDAKPDAALLQPQSSSSEGSVSVEGHRIDYKAVAGTLVLHGSGDKENEPQVSMFYVAYFKKGAEATKRPVTFIYNSRAWPRPRYAGAAHGARSG